jgi:hypothetical protein
MLLSYCWRFVPFANLCETYANTLLLSRLKLFIGLPELIAPTRPASAFRFGRKLL